MRFYCITNDSQSSINESFQKACKAQGIEYVPLDPIDSSHLRVPTFQNGDLLYRVHTGDTSQELEWHCIRKGITSLHSDELRQHVTYRKQSRIFEAAGIPFPSVVRHATNNKELLKEYAQHLGGFPLVLKIGGSQSGIGVMRIDSLTSLYSITDYLVAQKTQFILMECIDVTQSARFIVLGDQVIGSIEYNAPKDDFRSNVQGTQPVEKEYAQSIQDIAIAATKAIGTEFAGVDILIDQQGAPYVTEANFPCYFPRVESVTGIDVAGQIISYLAEKARNA